MRELPENHINGIHIYKIVLRRAGIQENSQVMIDCHLLFLEQGKAVAETMISSPIEKLLSPELCSFCADVEEAAAEYFAKENISSVIDPEAPPGGIVTGAKI